MCIHFPKTQMELIDMQNNTDLKKVFFSVNLEFFFKSYVNFDESTYVCKQLFLYPPQRGYISFVNTFVTPRNNDLGPYVPWRHLISAKF